MPQLNGLDTTREIKTRCPVIRVIVLALEPHHHSLALQAGADACVLKGIRSEELLRVIAQLGFEVASVWPFGASKQPGAPVVFDAAAPACRHP